MNPAHGFHANERIVLTLADFAAESELAGLGDAAFGIIHAELRRAGLQNQTEDVFQNVLLITWGECRRGVVRAVRSFFLTVSRFEARRLMRKTIRSERNDPKVQAWLAQLNGDVCLPEEPVCDERELILKAMDRLPPARRRIIELMMIEGLDNAQAMAELGLTPAAYRTAKCRAVRELRDLLKVEKRDRPRRKNG